MHCCIRIGFSATERKAAKLYDLAAFNMQREDDSLWLLSTTWIGYNSLKDGEDEKNLSVSFFF